MIITTTNAVDGYRVVQYLTPVTVSLVEGTDFFSDFVAGFTDTFGGRSGTYQAALAQLHDAALQHLEQKGKAAGANCLLGVKFDLGEVSGKGRQMFMLNAVATPVVIKTDAEIAADAEAAELARVEKERRAAERRERFAGIASIDGLLNDPEIAKTARERRRLYGPNVCVDYLKGVARELGLGEIDLTAADLPDTF